MNSSFYVYKIKLGFTYPHTVKPIYDSSGVVKESTAKTVIPSVYSFFLRLFVFGCGGSSLLHAAFSSYNEQGLVFIVRCRLLIALASSVVEHRLGQISFSSCSA